MHATPERCHSFVRHCYFPNFRNCEFYMSFRDVWAFPNGILHPILAFEVMQDVLHDPATGPLCCTKHCSKGQAISFRSAGVINTRLHHDRASQSFMHKATAHWQGSTLLGSRQGMEIFQKAFILFSTKLAKAFQRIDCLALVMTSSIPMSTFVVGHEIE